MKILLTGATGMIGRKLGQHWVGEGHQIVALSRSPSRARFQLAYPAEIFQWDALREPAPTAAFRGVDVIVHLVGEGIADQRWTPARKKILKESRILATQNLLAGLKSAQVSVSTLISASAIGIYPSSGSLQDEMSPEGTGFVADLCREWEDAAKQIATVQPNCRLVTFRIPPVLSLDGGFLKKLEPIFCQGLGGRLGSGQQGFSFIHIRDLIAVFDYALKESQLKGPINACAPVPTTNGELTSVYNRVLKQSGFLPVPKLALQVMYGELAQLLFADQRVHSNVLPKNIFRFPDILAALQNLYPEDLGPNEYRVHYEIWLPQSIDQIFPFFESAHNLEAITPAFLNFKVLRQSTAEIASGTVLDYKLRLHGIPLRWRTLIQEFEKNKCFVDTQEKGPYQKWHHRHEFRPFGGGTLCTDTVRFQLPLGRLAKLVAGGWVQRDVDEIFEYRTQRLIEKFG